MVGKFNKYFSKNQGVAIKDKYKYLNILGTQIRIRPRYEKKLNYD